MDMTLVRGIGPNILCITPPFPRTRLVLVTHACVIVLADQWDRFNINTAFPLIEIPSRTTLLLIMENLYLWDCIFVLRRSLVYSAVYLVRFETTALVKWLTKHHGGVIVFCCHLWGSGTQCLQVFLASGKYVYVHLTRDDMHSSLDALL